MAKTIDEIIGLVPVEMQAEYGRLHLKAKSLSAAIQQLPIVQELNHVQNQLRQLEQQIMLQAPVESPAIPRNSQSHRK